MGHKHLDFYESKKKKKNTVKSIQVIGDKTNDSCFSKKGIDKWTLVFLKQD